MAFVPAAPDLTAAFAEAVRQLERLGVQRKDLAARLGVEPSTVSRYVTGKLSVPLELLPAIDVMCGKRKGYVLRLAGFVDDEMSTEEAISSDPALTETGRATVASYYRFVRDEYDERKSTR